MCERVEVCVWVYMYVWEYICVRVYVCVRVHVSEVSLSFSLPLYTYPHTHVLWHTSTFIRVHAHERFQEYNQIYPLDVEGQRERETATQSGEEKERQSSTEGQRYIAYLLSPERWWESSWQMEVFVTDVLHLSLPLCAALYCLSPFSFISLSWHIEEIGNIQRR